MSYILLDGKTLAHNLNLDLKNRISNNPQTIIIRPTLVIIQVGNNLASNSYIKGKIKACELVGIVCQHIKYLEDISQDEIVDLVQSLNSDNYVHGIIIQLPLPKHINVNTLINYIKPNKDVDGFTVYNKGLLFDGSPGTRPATPQGIMTLLNHYNIDLVGMNAVVIGRSNIVGMPIAKMLIDANATVTVAHSKTKKLPELTKNADLLISAIGIPHFIKDGYVKNNAIVIDVGINKINNKLVGDVDFDEVCHKTSHITPVPGGVGPLTIASLLENTYQAYLKIVSKLDISKIGQILFETNRLVIRRWLPTDIDDMYEYGSQIEVSSRTGYPQHQSKNDTRVVLNRFVFDDTKLAIVLKSEDKVIGGSGFEIRPTTRDNAQDFEREIGYTLNKNYHNQGYATELTKGMLEYGFKVMKLSVIRIAHYAPNMQSKKVIEKCRFIYDGKKRVHNYWPFGSEKLHDLYQYSLTCEEYEKLFKKGQI